MAEAKRKKQQAAALAENLRPAVTRVSHALRKLATAASGQFGGDCYVHAVIGQQLLKDLGFECQLVVGYAAWRVGDGDSDVISHTKEVDTHLPPGVKGAVYHAWLEHDGCLVDFSTYQCKRTANTP